MNPQDVKITSQVRKIRKVGDIDGIRLTVTGFVYKPGRNFLKKNIPDDQYLDFMLYVAVRLATTVVDAIDSQRYKHAWKPLSLSYVTYKQKHNLSLKIYEATGQMRDSIRVFKDGKYIGLGFPKNKRYPKSHVQINTIARYLEFGSRDNAHPPSRPLWRPLQVYVRKNIWRYFMSYLNEKSLQHKKYLLLLPS